MRQTFPLLLIPEAVNLWSSGPSSASFAKWDPQESDCSNMAYLLQGMVHLPKRSFSNIWAFFLTTLDIYSQRLPESSNVPQTTFSFLLTITNTNHNQYIKRKVWFYILNFSKGSKSRPLPAWCQRVHRVCRGSQYATKLNCVHECRARNVYLANRVRHICGWAVAKRNSGYTKLA